MAGLFGSSSDLSLTQKLEFLKEKLNRAGSPSEAETETSNIDEAPPLPQECKNKVINENCGLIPRHYKPFEHVQEENGVQLFKCNYCAQVRSIFLLILETQKGRNKMRKIFRLSNFQGFLKFYVF